MTTAEEIADITAKRDAVQARIDKLQADFKIAIDAAQAELDGYAKRLAELANMTPDEATTMKAYFADPATGKQKLPLGDSTKAKLSGLTVGVSPAPKALEAYRDGKRVYGAAPEALAKGLLSIGGYGWNTGKYEIRANGKAIGAFTVTGDVVVKPPVITPPTTATSGDPRRDYPVAFPYSPIPQDPNGWTDFKPSIDSKRIFVSPGGSDTNSGSDTAPVRTLAKAKSMVRQGQPDWIYLQRGGSYGDVGSWGSGGRSQSEPMVLGAYGTGPRPIVGGLTSPQGKTVNNVAFLDLDFYNRSRDSTASGFNLASVVDGNFGVDWLATGNCIHFEGCRIAWWGYNLQWYGPSGLILRRCVIQNAWQRKGDKAQGLYVNNAAGDAHNGTPGPAMTVEECVIDHNGWNQIVNGAPPKGQGSGTWIFSHGVYASEHAGPMLFRRNIVSRSANNGLNIRPGGVLEDNLAIDNSSQMYVGRMTQPQNLDLECWMLKNVLCHANHGNGFGLETPYWKAGKVEENLVLPHMANAGNGFAIRIDPARPDPYIPGQQPFTPDSASISVNRNRFLGGNIRVWATAKHRITATMNVCPEGVLYEFGSPVQPGIQPPAKSAPIAEARDVASYNAKVLNRAADYNDFCDRACKMERENWDPKYTAGAGNEWIREGYRQT